MACAARPGPPLTQLLFSRCTQDTPFTTIAASEIFSLEMNKTEALTQARGGPARIGRR